jgi:chorismate mutase
VVKPDLDLIAAKLEGLEETIIAKLIDRAQFKVNQNIYQEGASGFDGAEGCSLFFMRLRRQEEMDALFGRFRVPEERPFTKELPSPKRGVSLGESCLSIKDFDYVSVTSRILPAYMDLVRDLCSKGDDGQYGSSVEHDVYALQAISRRIHFGALYVAECKYRANSEKIDALVARQKEKELLELLTRPEVEKNILERIVKKVDRMQAESNPRTRKIIKPEIIYKFYQDTVIPLTKKGEILYLLYRKVDSR